MDKPTQEVTVEKPQKVTVEKPPQQVIQVTGTSPSTGNGEVVTVTTTLVSPINNPDDLALLAKLEQANRELEKNQKCMQTLQLQMNKSSNNSAGHSRKGSDTSMISTNSASSSFQADDDASPDDLWNIWGKLVNDWDNQRKKRPNYIRDLVRRGIPVHFRGIAWQLMCNAHLTPYKEQYAEYLKQSSPQEKVIRRDITRTYPEHEFFKEKNGLGQESLFNVMKAFSLHDREVGYCQGSGFIVGLLLMQMPEEEAFAVLVQLMAEYRLRELFKPSMAELGLMMFQLECMIQEQLPDLYIHFQSQNIYISMFASPWFLTLFTTVLPLHAACRVFDVFLSEGVEMVFRVGFSILYLNYDELLNLDLEGTLKFFQKTIPAKYDTDIDVLMTNSFHVKYNPKRMKKLEKEYNALKSKEHEDQVELRRLRTENRLLRQRIENLEKETGTLADRLIQDQVIRAQREEENFTLRRDLCSLKNQNASNSQKLEDTQEELRSIKERASVVASQAVFSKLPTVDDRERQQQLESTIRSQKQQIDDHVATMKQMQARVRELEHINNQLQTDPSEEIQVLQEELIACKLREAEANRSMQELRQRVNDLEKYWQKFQERANAPESSGKVSKDKLKALQEEVMNVRLREAQAIAELQEMKQKVMELETESHIHNRQIKRQDDENQKLQERYEEKEVEEKSLQDRIKEFQRQVTDLETKRKEDVMMARIKDAEHSQTIAEMRQRIAELEIENQELVTAGQLQEKGEAEALDSRIASLQEELMQLKMNKRLASISSLALNHSVDTESDYDTDDIEADKDRLLLSSSMTGSINIEGYPFHDIAKLRLGPDFAADSSENEDTDPSSTKTAPRTSRKKRQSKSKTNGDISDISNSDLTQTPDDDDLEGDGQSFLSVTRNSDGHSDGASTLSGDDKDNQSVDSGELTLTANTPMSPTAPTSLSNGALIEDFTAVD